jgi:hypothetical protein
MTTLDAPIKRQRHHNKSSAFLMEKFLSESTLEIRRVGVKVAGFSREEPKQAAAYRIFLVALV